MSKIVRRALDHSGSYRVGSDGLICPVFGVVVEVLPDLSVAFDGAGIDVLVGRNIPAVFGSQAIIDVTGHLVPANGPL